MSDPTLSDIDFKIQIIGSELPLIVKIHSDIVHFKQILENTERVEVGLFLRFDFALFEVVVDDFSKSLEIQAE